MRKKQVFHRKNPVDLECKTNAVFFSGSVRSDAKSTCFDELILKWAGYRHDVALEIRWNVNK